MNTTNWKYHYKSAASQRDTERGTDGGGADGYIYEGEGLTKRILAFAPHHRDPAEDAEREDILRLMSLAPALLRALDSLHGEFMSRMTLVREEDWTPEENAAEEVARLLIAKAKGTTRTPNPEPAS